jgi:hypothetical protein
MAILKCDRLSFRNHMFLATNKSIRLANGLTPNREVRRGDVIT